MQTKLLIKGKFTNGKGDALDILDPATGKVIVEVPEASEEQVNAAVLAAAGALDGWSRTAPKDRAALLLKVADRIEAEADTFAELESRNCGKPLAAVKSDEIPAIADVFRFFAGAARTVTGAIAGEYLARVHQHDPARSSRRGGVHRALELPADDGGLEVVARSGGG